VDFFAPGLGSIGDVIETRCTISSEVLLEVNKLNLTFDLSLFRPWTLRDVFTQTLKDPIGSLLSGPERFHVLKDISFQVRSGERVALLGVNGTGKTSLCRCIAGIYHATSGHIKTTGQIRAIFDTAVGILPELTGRENAYLLAKFMYPLDYKYHREMVEEALEFSQLGDFVDVPYRLYSNGMQARLCLSLISCKPGDLLILDEVFDGADIFFKEKISARIFQMIQQSGAVIFVSHSPDQIERVCNRVLLLDRGEIQFDGAVDEALQRYRRQTPALTTPSMGSSLN
jgi:ABC-type polysaccharide/polyol phosphate transport system ATPase subunit